MIKNIICKINLKTQKPFLFNYHRISLLYHATFFKFTLGAQYGSQYFNSDYRFRQSFDYLNLK